MTSASAADMDTWVDPKHGRLSLRFRDPALERRFRRENTERFLPLFRAGMAAGVVIYALFGIVEYRLAPEAAETLWLIRYAIICPLLAAITAFSFCGLFSRLEQPVMALAMLVAGCGILTIAAVAPPPANQVYYTGLVLVFIFFATFAWMRWYVTALVALSLIALYQVVAIAINPVPAPVLLNNDMFLLFAALLTVASNYALELYLRRNFITKERLLANEAHIQSLLEQARAASQAKSDFLAVMSHELRTPLNAIIGFSEVLKNELFGPLGSTRYHSYVEDIHASGIHLLAIINDILDLSKAEAGRIEMTEDEVEIDAVLDRCLRMCRENAVAKGVQMSLAEPLPACMLLVDRRLISQLLINLVTNAIKFTPRGGRVTIAAALTADGGCRLSVEDTGIGIARENLARVLEPFVQVENALSREHGGTGLGLPFAKRIAEIHGGRLELESEPGVGTLVSVYLPPSRVIASATAPLLHAG